MTAEQLSRRGTETCRACGAADLHSVLDLGEQPLANRLLRNPEEADPTYPLHLRICGTCALGQVGEFVTPEEIFNDYPYLSSMSSYWLEHLAGYARQMRVELSLTGHDLVVEVASNDGALLKGFRDAGLRVLGIEPAANVAAIAEAGGVPTECAFFGRETAERIRNDHGTPRLVAANNVMAHVPDLDDFVGGLAALSGPHTVITIENPGFTSLLLQRQFDTIYHEHFSYLSATAVSALAERHGLTLVRVEQLPTHGGSLRYWLAPRDAMPTDPSVQVAVEAETAEGLRDPSLWNAFRSDCLRTIDELRAWLDDRAVDGSVVAGYGAAAKGNTLLNAAGAGPDDLVAVTDQSPEKQGRYLPGSRIPVVPPSKLADFAPTDVLILPWNIASELRALIRDHVPEARIWIAIPDIHEVDA
ncbi:hypothetical protein ACVW00_001736 [Marmoricola sp. URHA0025 HA25]